MKKNDTNKKIDIINNTNGLFKVDDQNSAHLNEPLVKEKPLILAGNFLVNNIGSYRLTAQLTFKEGQPVSVSTATTQVVQVTVQGAIRNSLPKRMGLNTSADVLYTFKNDVSNVLGATQIQLEITDLEDVKITRGKTDDSSLGDPVDPADLNGNGTLDAGETLFVKGVFTGKAAGPNKGPSIHFSYAEGEVITFDNIQYGTEVVEVKVIGEISRNLSASMKLNETKEVRFTFMNQDPELSASDISVTITLDPVL